MNKKLFIFDLDGTLVNTVGGLNKSLNHAFYKNGLPLTDINRTAHAIGNGILITIRRLVPSGTSEQTIMNCLSDFRDYYKTHYMDDSFPYDGMFETLKELKKHGLKLAVATNKLDEIAKQMIKEMFPNIFDIIIGDSTLFNKKPDPMIINHITSYFNLNKEETIYIGDSEVDKESADNAGVDLILVDYGFHRFDDFYSIKAKHISKPHELLNCVKI